MSTESDTTGWFAFARAMELIARIEGLRVENERLRTENEELRAKLSTEFRAQLVDEMHRYVGKTVAKPGEVERLRAALKFAADADGPWNVGRGFEALVEVADRARAALAGTKEGT